ncbi:MAG: hypothetical protein E7353_08290 [Clostridiales bacterium]|nr:hypothetical protein [Clostridiales bacterium]
MKKRRLLLGAIVSILMCLCVMGGATFALFTDKADVEVNITAGTVDIDAKVDGGLKLYSMDRYMGDGVLEFENLGYATLTDENKITLVNITPGDKVEFDIAITSTSNVKTKVRTVVKETGVDTGLLKGLNVTVNDEDADLLTGEIVSEWVTVDPNANPADNVLSVAIELPAEAGNEYQGKKAELRFTVEAVQWNGVAIIGEDNLKTALVAGGEVKLESDIALSDDPILIAKDTVLDLNGYTLSATCNSGSDYLMAVKNGVKLDIKDTSAAQDGKVTFAKGASNVGWTIFVEGELNLHSGTIELTGDDWSIGYAVDLRPNAWGTAFTTGSVFNMYGGKIVSSDGAIRVASTSSESYANVSASFIMNGGEIISEYDGIFIQQSNTVYDILNVELLGGKIDSKLSAVRFYGPNATSVVGGVAKPMTLVLGGTDLVEATIDPNRTYLVDGKIIYAGGMSLDNLNTYTTIENR